MPVRNKNSSDSLKVTLSAVSARFNKPSASNDQRIFQTGRFGARITAIGVQTTNIFDSLAQNASAVDIDLALGYYSSLGEGGSTDTAAAPDAFLSQFGVLGADRYYSNGQRVGAPEDLADIRAYSQDLLAVRDTDIIIPPWTIVVITHTQTVGAGGARVIVEYENLDGEPK